MTLNALFLLLALCPCPVKRYPNGRIVRSWTAVRDFKAQSGFPDGRPGYVVDHVIPLCACGADDPRNMQWQRADSARMKDRLEVAACRKLQQQLDEDGFTAWKFDLDGRVVPLWDD